MPLDVFPTAPTPSLTPLEREEVDAFVAALRGAPLDETLMIVGALVDGGAWEPWMLGALLRVHKGEVAALLAGLAPLFATVRR